MVSLGRSIYLRYHKHLPLYFDDGSPLKPNMFASTWKNKLVRNDTFCQPSFALPLFSGRKTVSASQSKETFALPTFSSKYWNAERGIDAGGSPHLPKAFGKLF